MKLLERRSIRLYDKNVKINDDELKQIILEANLAPSSMNMQPWRYVIISSDEAKEKLRPGLYGNLRQLETRTNQGPKRQLADHLAPCLLRFAPAVAFFFGVRVDTSGQAENTARRNLLTEFSTV